MNFGTTGRIGLRCLYGDDWSPAIRIHMLLDRLHELLRHPDLSMVEVNEIAFVFCRQREQHDQLAREWTAKYAMPSAASLTGDGCPAASSGQADDILAYDVGLEAHGPF